MDRFKILDLEQALGRTPEARRITSDDLRADIKSLLAQDVDSLELSRCIACGLLAASDSFSSGCPNCNSKQHEEMEKPLGKEGQHV